MADVPLRPLGAKFYSAYLSPRPHNGLIPNGLWCWIDLYQNWDFAGFVQPQLDQMKALGLNCVTLNGAWTGEDAGLGGAWTMTDAEYVARRKIILQYCHDIGMFVLGYGQGRRFADGAPTQLAIDRVVADAAMMSAFPNCIGFVPISEILGKGYSQAISVSNVAAYYTPVKAAVPSDFGIAGTDDPCGVALSSIIFNPTTAGNMAAMAPYCDWLAFNTFGFNPAPADWAAVHAAYLAKDIMITSCGEDNDVAGATVTARFTAFMACANHAESRGASFWVNKDYMVTGENYGIFNNNDTERTAMTTPITAGLPAIPSPEHPVRFFPGNPRLNQHIRWGY